MSIKKLHPDEITIDLSLVKRLLKNQFPEYANLEIKPIDSMGTDNVIFRLSDDKAIRLPRTSSAAKQIDKEYKWLPQLKKQISLEIPNPIAKGNPDELYPYNWLIFRWIEGQNGINEPLFQDQAAFDLANFILQLRKISTHGASASARGYPLKNSDNEVRESLKKLNSLIDTTKAKIIWDSVIKEHSEDYKPAWIHSDLHAGNIIVNEGRIKAIIDFGMAGTGDPACDLMAAWTLLRSESRKEFKEILKPDKTSWQRGKGWALSFSVIALPYYQNTNNDLANIALKTINEVLND